MSGWTRRRRESIASGAAIVFGLAVIGAHAGLTSAGAWQADEYYNFALLRHLGGWFLLGRVVQWSPRPLSEAVMALYAWGVDWLHRPLIWPFLLMCWLVLAVAMAAGWRRRNVTVPVSLFALFLLGGPVSEMFYWPMAAAAYLLCLAAVAFVTLRLVQGGQVRLACAAALVVAACSAELGAVFALCLCPVLMALEGRGPGRLWRMSCWAAPLCIGAGVVTLLAFGRVSYIVDAPGLGNPFFHRLGASAGAAFWQFGRELIGDGSWVVLLGSALVFAGFVACLRGRVWDVPGTRLVALVGALLATAYGSILAAYYQFGLLCCERHETFRHCLVLLVLLAVAALVASGLGPGRRGWVGPGLLVAGMALGLAGRAGDLVHDYRLAGAMVAARQASWRSGLAGGDAMLVRLPPLGRVVGPRWWVAPGRYDAVAGQAWFVSGLMLFFDHPTLIVMRPAG